MKYDIVGISEERSEAFCSSFVKTFLPNFMPSQDDYPVPWLDDNTIEVLPTAEILIKYMCLNTNNAYAIYWENKKQSEPQSGWINFTEDSHTIVGLSVEQSNVIEWEQKLKQFLESDTIISGFEIYPFLNSKEFFRLLKVR